MSKPRPSARDRLRRCVRWLWKRMPPFVLELRPVRALGEEIHRRAYLGQEREQSLFTRFFRNRPQLAVLREVAASYLEPSMSMAVLGCSTGAEVYSVVYTARNARPDLPLTVVAMDIDGSAVERARGGIYTRRSPELEWLSGAEIALLFEESDDSVRVKDWLRCGVSFRVGDASDPALAARIGLQDVVFANNFLIHMPHGPAEACFVNIAHLVAPSGHLFVSGVDLDLKTRLLPGLELQPVTSRLEQVHNDDSKRSDWPWGYWGLEPLDKRRPDWEARYCTVYRRNPARHA